MYDDIEQEHAKLKRRLVELEDQLSEYGLSKQEKKELIRKKRTILKEMMVLEKVSILENKNLMREGGDNRKMTLRNTRRSSNGRIIGFLFMQFILLIFQIIFFDIIINIISIFLSSTFLITLIIAILLSYKSNRPIWSENNENVEKNLFVLISLFSACNLILGVARLLSYSYY